MDNNQQVDAPSENVVFIKRQDLIDYFSKWQHKIDAMINENNEACERLDAVHTNLEDVRQEIATVIRMLKLSNKYLKGFNYVK